MAPGSARSGRRTRASSSRVKASEVTGIERVKATPALDQNARKAAVIAGTPDSSLRGSSQVAKPTPQLQPLRESAFHKGSNRPVPLNAALVAEFGAIAAAWDNRKAGTKALDQPLDALNLEGPVSIRDRQADPAPALDAAGAAVEDEAGAEAPQAPAAGPAPAKKQRTSAGPFKYFAKDLLLTYDGEAYHEDPKDADSVEQTVDLNDARSLHWVYRQLWQRWLELGQQGRGEWAARYEASRQAPGVALAAARASGKVGGRKAGGTKKKPDGWAYVPPAAAKDVYVSAVERELGKWCEQLANHEALERDAAARNLSVEELQKERGLAKQAAKAAGKAARNGSEDVPRKRARKKSGAAKKRRQQAEDDEPEAGSDESDDPGSEPDLTDASETESEAEPDEEEYVDVQPNPEDPYALLTDSDDERKAARRRGRKASAATSKAGKAAGGKARQAAAAAQPAKQGGRASRRGEEAAAPAAAAGQRTSGRATAKAVAKQSMQVSHLPGGMKGASRGAKRAAHEGSGAAAAPPPAKRVTRSRA